MKLGDAYVQWVMEHSEQLRQNAIAIREGDGWKTTVLHREGRHQVEEVMLVGLSRVPLHRHPHINSIEHYLDGDFMLIVSGHLFPLNENSRSHRRSIPITASDVHGAEIGPAGAHFLSIQEWLGEGPITSVADDWEGSTEKVTRYVDRAAVH